jgi:para-nitrobenzyl esterase
VIGRTVGIAAGRVVGTEIGDGILAWRGIPYAAPPVGPLRLRLPQPVDPWSGVRDATAYGPPALQAAPAAASARGGMGGVLGGAGPVLPPPSEDCLYLNVTAPAGARHRPVLLWLHGGGYESGNGTQFADDGSSFVDSHGLVVVTINYRLGALGFLAVDGEEHTGAFGLLDQIAALRWVRANIAEFGGDPSQVTVYGISAGAKSVANLLGSPLTPGLIRRAASSSGGADHVATPAQAAAVARRFFRELGTSPARIRDVPAAEILHAQLALADGLRTAWVWRPAIDGLALAGRPLEAIAAGAAAGVPLLAQHCVNEAALFQLGAPDAAKQAGPVLESYFGPAGRDEILDAYRRARPDLARDATRLGVEVMTDERYAIPTTRLADAQSAHAPVWRSRYDGPLTGMPKIIAESGTLPAFHGTDGALIWSGGAGLKGQLHDAWATFAATGNPSAGNPSAGNPSAGNPVAGAPADALPPWPAYTTARRATMIFDSAGPYLADDPHAEQRAAWDGRDWQSGTWWQFGDSGR